MNRLKAKYNDEIIPSLKEKFNYANVMEVPKLEKIVKDLNYKIKIIDYKDCVKNIIGICIWAYPKELDD